MSAQRTKNRSTAALRRNMSVKEFDAGYFYAAELKRFAREIGISVGNRRKFEVEDLIRSFLETGVVPTSQPTLPRNKGEERDRLVLDEQVRNYVDDKETKEFLLDAVRSSSPGIKKKSGQWYWLND
ncbi:SAP domain-containing protein [Corynebacterium kutscheri]|nr:SAP domain-containing protein [Corynebacterium kutscheri]